MATLDDMAVVVMVGDDVYEVARARVDLAEAIAERDMARTASEREMAAQRAEDARSRLVRWRRGWSTS